MIAIPIIIAGATVSIIAHLWGAGDAVVYTLWTLTGAAFLLGLILGDQ